MKFHERIKELRINKGISQMDFAKATGISQSAIAKWELGKTEPTASAIVTLAVFFGETSDYLLGLTDEYKSVRFGENADTTSYLSLEEEKLLTKYRELSAKEKALLTQYIEILR